MKDTLVTLLEWLDRETSELQRSLKRLLGNTRAEKSGDKKRLS
jgi:hypothetical protein